MGLFNKIKVNQNIELALQICNYYQGGVVSPPYTYKVQRLIKKCGSKKDCLMAAISLCGIPTTPKQLYIVSHCYFLAGALYRPQAIEYLLKYIKLGAVWEGTPKDNINIDGYIINQLSLNKASVYYNLGKSYEGEYQFDDALNWYFKSLKINPTSSPAVYAIADVYVKKNCIDDGLKFLQSYRNSKYKDVRLIVDEKSRELRDKKAKGYVYKPRPRKKDTTMSHP